MMKFDESHYTVLSYCWGSYYMFFKKYYINTCMFYVYFWLHVLFLTPLYLFSFWTASISFCLPGCLQTVLLCQAPKYELIGMYRYALCSSLLCLIITCWLGIVKWPAHFFLVKLLNHTYKVCHLVLFVVL